MRDEVRVHDLGEGSGEFRPQHLVVGGVQMRGDRRHAGELVPRR
ncbi:hypothetical protein [Streptomyces catenulae]|uniref:Uncharacterized protein n=1 Tax=Streptomyces catenulae TaxID=66875 RepID=A0ABV2Z1Z9_9ACTN|nr:hypothetical protein [Streptomyces catenulae]